MAAPTHYAASTLPSSDSEDMVGLAAFGDRTMKNCRLLLLTWYCPQVMQRVHKRIDKQEHGLGIGIVGRHGGHCQLKPGQQGRLQLQMVRTSW